MGQIARAGGIRLVSGQVRLANGTRQGLSFHDPIFGKSGLFQYPFSGDKVGWPLNQPVF